MAQPVRIVQAEAWMAELEELLDTYGLAPLPVSGSSMTPFLAPGRDTVHLAKITGPLRRGNLVLYRRDSGAYVLHRIYACGDGVYTMVGDRQTRLEFGIRRDQILAIAVSAMRKGKLQQPGCFWWDFFEKVWIHCIGLRPWVLRLYGKFAQEKELT